MKKILLVLLLVTQLFSGNKLLCKVYKEQAVNNATLLGFAIERHDDREVCALVRVNIKDIEKVLVYCNDVLPSTKVFIKVRKQFIGINRLCIKEGM